MEFLILGPLEVLAEGRALPLGGQKQRAVLALLLLHANEVVSTDRLIDELWGEEPPATVQTVLQVYVSRLRKLLEPGRARGGGEGVLVTRAPGYLLWLKAGRLDLHRFEALLGEGRAAVAAGNPEEAARLLRDALALWRGPALADFAHEPFAQAEIARLEELRLAALEDRVEADLALGRHADLVGELEALIARHPQRERLRGQLMLALYRSGRQAEALEVYQETRRVLVDELGIDPSPALQRLEKAILNQDPELELPPRAGPAEAAPPTPPIEVAPSEERKLVTMLFAELGGLDDGEDPERRRALVDRFYDATAEEIEAAGGTVDTLVGDAVVAVFGAPAAQEDHAQRALHAALALRRSVEERTGTHALRIGVDTGQALVGSAREGGSLVTGKVVQAASRLQQAAAAGEILVGERTAAAAGGAYEFGEPTAVAGKEACRRLERAVAAGRPRGMAGLRSVFVGRESEVELLRTTYQRAAQQGEAHLVTIVGNPGVGKTSLARELWDWLDEHPSEPVRRAGRCLSYGQGITYWPLAEVLREELGLLETDPPETVRERLEGGEILGLTLGLDVAGGLHPLTARDRLHEAWVELLEELTSERPAAVFVEDLHWAEEPLLDLLDRILRDVKGPLLVVATARPELLDSRPAWGGRRNSVTIWLEPLSAENAGRMLEELLAEELPERLRELVLERAEGNPFFVEELLATLIDQGVLRREEGSWAVRELPEGFAVPDSVQAVLAARIDLLEQAEKAALQAASVVGRVFWAGPVCELLEGVEPDFAVLEARDFIRRRSGSVMAGEREFAIRHALTREVAYAGLPKARRARLHAAFAGWLERFGEGRDEHAPFLAHHYAEAARPEDADLAWAGDEDELARLTEKAVAWLRRAADLAVARYALDEGLALLERALELEMRTETQAGLWQAIGHANALKFDGAGFWTAMQTALELSPDPSVRADIYSELAFQTATRPGMWPRSPEPGLVEDWVERALELAEAGSPARARALLAGARWNPAEGRAAALEASEIAQRLADAKLRTHAWRSRVETLVATGQYAQARAALAESRQLLDEITDPELRSCVHCGAGMANLGSARLDEARRYALLHDEAERGLTPHHAVHGVALRLVVEELCGRWETVRELTAEIEQRVAANATYCAFNPRSLLVCAAGSADAGDEANARRLEESADELGMEGYGMTIDGPRVRLALLRGDLETVERVLAQPFKAMIFVELAALAARLDGLAALRDRSRVEQAAPRLARPKTILEPFALRALGIVREDAALLERAAARFAALGLDWHEAQTRSLL